MGHAITMVILAASTARAAPVPPGAQALCAGRSGCSVTQVQDAGTGTDATPLQVVTLAVERAADGSEGQTCAASEVWRMQPPARVLRLCNDGYGASGVGEDTVTVGPNTLTHGRYGGSAWRWTTAHQWTLSPLALVASSSSTFHAAAPDHESETHFDRISGVQTTRWSTPQCGGLTGAFVVIPQAGPVPEALPLHTCAARADATGTLGHLVHGAPGTPSDTSLWVSASSATELVIDIVDDTWVSEPPTHDHTWVHTDHVELWVGSTRPDPSMDWDCPDATAAQWGILLDGQVVPAAGALNSAPPTARRVVPGPPGRVRLVVQIPDTSKSVTVIYSDSDGQSQERMIATSDVHFGRQAHLALQLGGIAALVDTGCAAGPEGWSVIIQ